MAGDDRLGWATRQALARGTRKGRVDCQGGTVHVGLIADCAFEPVSPPLQFRIWLFSPLKLSMGKDHRLHLRVHSVDFQRPLLSRSFDNPIETRTRTPLVRPKKKSTEDSSRSSSFPKNSPPLVECTPSLFSWPTSRAAGVDKPWSLHRPGSLRSSRLRYADLAQRVPADTWIESSHDLDKPGRAHDPTNDGAPER